eukprot:scaffold6870_cov113-Isochrysis_galbana.AAC.2
MVPYSRRRPMRTLLLLGLHAAAHCASLPARRPELARAAPPAWLAGWRREPAKLSPAGTQGVWLSTFLFDQMADTLTGALTAAIAIRCMLETLRRLGILLRMLPAASRRLARGSANAMSAYVLSPALAVVLAPLRLAARLVPPRAQRAPVHALLALMRTPPARVAWRATRAVAAVSLRAASAICAVLPTLLLFTGASLALCVARLDGPGQLHGRARAAVRQLAAAARRPLPQAAVAAVGAALSLSRNEGLRRAARFNAGMVPMALDYHAAKWLYTPAPAAVRHARFEALHEKHKDRPLRLILSLGGFYVKIGQVCPDWAPFSFPKRAWLQARLQFPRRTSLWTPPHRPPPPMARLNVTHPSSDSRAVNNFPPTVTGLV